MQTVELVGELLDRVEAFIKNHPIKDFGDVFNGSKYSFKDKKNPFFKRSHSAMISILVKEIWAILEDIEGDYLLEVEPRLSYKHKDGSSNKFSPDIVVYRLLKGKPLEECEPILYIDYESPNSSDARVKSKDIDAFIYFEENRAKNSSFVKDTKYLVITSHRDYKYKNDLARVWNYRYNSDELKHDKYKKIDKILVNPWKYWSEIYVNCIKEWKEYNFQEADDIILANISRGVFDTRYPPKY